jgi:hypothetical protein
LQAHRKWWECIEGCNEIFRSLHPFHEHLAKEHEVLVDNDRTVDLVRNCERQESMTTQADCKLCDMKLPTLTQLRRHVGKHHEELSLFALPSHMNEDDDEHDEGDVENHLVSSAAGSEGSQSLEQVICDQCGLKFEGDRENRQAALSRHMEDIHDQNARISNMEDTDPRFVVAKELLRKQPDVVTAMDEQIIDETLLHHFLRLYLPEDINTWMQLKVWVTEHTRGFDFEQIPVLQAVQFQTMVKMQESAPAKDSQIEHETSAADTTLRTPWPTFEDTVPVKDIVPIDEMQKTWQCTFCLKRLPPKSWRRHEETQHRPKYQWTCLATGPRNHTQTDDSSMCVFCQLENPSEDHLISSHRIQECLEKPETERRFIRPDQLRQHVKKFHGTELLDTVKDQWLRPARQQLWTCGFCNANLKAWDTRETHIADHFRDGLTMSSWQKFPPMEDLPISEQVYASTSGSIPPSSLIKDVVADGASAIPGMLNTLAPEPPPNKIISESSMPMPLANRMISCPRCTLENHPSLTTCEICGAWLAIAQSSSSNLKSAGTKAQFDGVPNLSPETWAKVDTSSIAMFFWALTEDGVTMARWHILWEFLQDFSLHDNHIHMKGLLYHDDQPELKDFTMSFRDKHEAGSIYAKVARAIERDTARLRDVQPNPRQTSGGTDQTSQEGTDWASRPIPDVPSLQVPAAERGSSPYASTSTAANLESRAEKDAHGLFNDANNAWSQRPLPQNFSEITRAISPASTPQHYLQIPDFTAPESHFPEIDDEVALPSRQISSGVPEINIDFVPLSRHAYVDPLEPPEINIDFAPPLRQANYEPPSVDPPGNASLVPPERSRSRQSSSARTSRSAPFEPRPEPEKHERVTSHPKDATFQCILCPKRFTRAYNLRSHLRTHTDERPFICSVCGKAFARQHDRKRHEALHAGEKKFVCRGTLDDGSGRKWGCGRRFAQADSLGRHFRSDTGRVCIRPLLEEEAQSKGRSKDSAAYRNVLLELAKPRDNDNEDKALMLDEFYETEEEEYQEPQYNGWEAIDMGYQPAYEPGIELDRSPQLQGSKGSLDPPHIPQPEPKNIAHVQTNPELDQPLDTSMKLQKSPEPRHSELTLDLLSAPQPEPE